MPKPNLRPYSQFRAKLDHFLHTTIKLQLLDKLLRNFKYVMMSSFECVILRPIVKRNSSHQKNSLTSNYYFDRSFPDRPGFVALIEEANTTV